VYLYGPTKSCLNEEVVQEIYPKRPTKEMNIYQKNPARETCKRDLKLVIETYLSMLKSTKKCVYNVQAQRVHFTQYG